MKLHGIWLPSGSDRSREGIRFLLKAAGVTTPTFRYPEQTMKLEMKLLLLTGAVCLIACAYALVQGNFGTAGYLAFVEVLILINVRREMRIRTHDEQEYRSKV
jgi:hypothetical protein